MSSIGVDFSLIKTFVFLFLSCVAQPAVADRILLMAEEEGCYWCDQWTFEIGAIYSKTTEGQSAPLKRYDLHAGPPPDITLAMPVNFTPTFMLIQDGVEVGRIEGYPGSNFFWGLLDQLIQQAPAVISSEG